MKTCIVTNLQNSNCDKFKNSNCDLTRKIKLTKLKNSNCDKTQINKS